MVRYFFFFLLMFSSSLQAATSLPRNLTENESKRALEILGFGSAGKILGNPYPLGGYKGIEIGLSSEFIPAEDLAALGSKTTEKGEINYYTLSFGKGIYYNLDTYLYFTPVLQSEKIQAFGGLLRWGFYEPAFFPLTLTAVLNMGGANFSNLVNVNTFEIDLIATVVLDNVAIYFGGGQSRAIGKFIGGPDGITSNQETVEHDIKEGHTLFGININFNKIFFAFEIDRYADSFYGGKLGYRF